MERPQTDSLLLEVRGLSKRFGGIKAVEDVSFGIPEKGIISMIGPNGAGKSTFINVVSGVYTPDAGEVHLEGEDVAACFGLNQMVGVLYAFGDALARSQGADVVARDEGLELFVGDLGIDGHAISKVRREVDVAA